MKPRNKMLRAINKQFNSVRTDTLEHVDSKSIGILNQDRKYLRRKLSYVGIGALFNVITSKTKIEDAMEPVLTIRDYWLGRINRVDLESMMYADKRNLNKVRYGI